MWNIDDLKNRLRPWVNERIRAAAGSMVWFSTVSKATADGYEDAVDGHKTDPDEEDYQLDGRRVEPFGFRSFPPEGIAAGMLKALAGAANGLIFGVADKKYGPSDLESGEVMLYCKTENVYIKLDKDGKATWKGGTSMIEITKDGDVVVNGGTAKVARVGDSISGHVHVEGGNAGPYTVVGSTQSATDTINSGADKFKA